MSYKIIIPSSKEELKEYYELRFEVLRKPWGQTKASTKDEWEDQSLHVLMVDENGKPVATGRLQYNSDDEGQIRSMAVSEEFRGRGLGTDVLKFLEKKAEEKNFSKIILDARDLAVKFYEKNGYIVEGNSYTLFNVIPHFRMVKFLKVHQY